VDFKKPEKCDQEAPGGAVLARAVVIKMPTGLRAAIYGEKAEGSSMTNAWKLCMPGWHRPARLGTV